jgi:hypothetical protein
MVKLTVERDKDVEIVFNEREELDEYIEELEQKNNFLEEELQ